MKRAVWLALAAACTPPTPTSPPPTPGLPVPAGASPTPTALATAASGQKPWTAPADPRATTMAAELGELGLDPKALPPLDKLDPTTLRSVMKTFTRALGVQCSECHETKDFRKPTPKKTIATHMWNEFARPLATKDGAPLYCDGCHQGKATFLDRSDAKQLGAWMDHAYVGALDNEPGCKTCHGDPFEPHIFAKRWR